MTRTEQAKHILSMIEQVDPSDTDKLDEIDARVECYLNTTYKQEFISLINRRGRERDGFSFYYEYNNGKKGTSSHNLSIRYTRRRDALKAIRPDKYVVSYNNYRGLNYKSGRALDEKNNTFQMWDPETGRKFNSPNNLTEEQAELHAIIQAYLWEEQNNE